LDVASAIAGAQILPDSPDCDAAMNLRRLLATVLVADLVPQSGPKPATPFFCPGRFHAVGAGNVLRDPAEQ